MTTTLTRLEPWLVEERRAAASAEATALVIVWSSAEPDRLGEVLILGEDGPAQLLGRGGVRQDDRWPRASFLRQRPWGAEARGPLEAPGISRKHLLLRPSGTGIAFEQLGRAAVLCNGRRAEAGIVEPGGVLTVEGQLSLHCVRRPSPLQAPRYTSDSQRAPFGQADPDGLVGESAAAWALREEIAFTAAASSHTLILGESGTGKELVATAIHRLSACGRKALLARSAVSFPATLIDAELFGNMRNYPNPGMAAREGLFGAAHGTSLFLDEIGELPADAQAHLLRVLDAGGQYHRLGEPTSRRSEFRLIAATNRALGSLKEDFAARFPLRVRVPSLNARREDIPLLCHHLVLRAASEHPRLHDQFVGKVPNGGLYCRFDPSFIELLVRHPYSLHVRELSELLWASMRESRGSYLKCPARALVPRKAAEGPPVRSPGPEPTVLEIRDALAQHGGNQSRAYVALGLSSRYALRRLLKKRGVEREV